MAGVSEALRAAGETPYSAVATAAYIGLATGAMRLARGLSGTPARAAGARR